MFTLVSARISRLPEKVLDYGVAAPQHPISYAYIRRPIMVTESNVYDWPINVYT